MSEPQFTRVGTTQLYWLDPNARTAGLLVSPSASFGSQVSLTQSWSDTGGVYVFLGAPPSNDAQFASDLRQYLVMNGWPNGPRYVWIADPTIPMMSWRGQTLNVSAQGGSFVVSRRVDFALMNFTLSIVPGSVVTLAGSATAAWGFSFAQNVAPIVLTAPGGSFPAQSGSPALLSFTVAGAWQFPFVSNAPSGAPSGLDALGVGLRYFYPTPQDNYVGVIALNALAQPPSTTVTLYATIDPLRPLDPAHTLLSFFPFGGGSGPSFAFTSGFATIRGYFVDLTPQAASGTLGNAGLAFAFQPLAVGNAGQVPGELYLVPCGGFGITVRPPAGVASSSNIHQLLCGASGLEYVGLPIAGGATLSFIPGCAAFAPVVEQRQQNAPTLTRVGTTAWCWVNAPTATNYFAQPEDAPLFKHPDAHARDDTSVLLEFFELPTATLPPPGPALAFPMAPYRGLDPSLVSVATDLENRAIAPARRDAILAATQSVWLAETGALAEDGTTIGVTPQGLSVGVDTTTYTWSWLGLGNDRGDQAAQPDLMFTRVGGRLRQAVQTNQLFMVLGDPVTFFSQSDITYQLTAFGIGVVATLPPTQRPNVDVLQAVSAYFKAQGYRSYPSEAAFVGALRNAYQTMSDKDILTYQRQAGMLTPMIDDWRFQLSPRNWLNPNVTAAPNTYMIFKFALGSTLVDLVRDTSRWTWSQAAAPDGKYAQAQKDILGIFDAAVESSKAPESPYRSFVELIGDENWTGILVLSCTVPLDSLPEPLQMLAAGIDPARFYAHHIGFNITPFAATTTALQFGRTSMFGLIDYRDPVDQYFSTNIPFAFKVLRLTTQFKNSAVCGFSSQVELMMNQLFGTTTRIFPADRGNNVVLDGVYQRQRLPDGSEQRTYVFNMTGQTTVLLENTALRAVDLVATQLVTMKPADVAAGDVTVAASFQITGNMWFYTAPLFDLFSWGPIETPPDVPPPDGVLFTDTASYLRFSNLAVGMSFALGDPRGTTQFVLRDAGLTFDMANSKPRPNAFAARFPVTLDGFVAEAGRMPEDDGFVSVSAPLEQSKLAQPWYGLVYRIDLGSLGALAAATGISLRVLAAWSTGGTFEQPAMYLGVRLPGVHDALGVSLPLQGVIDLGFRSIGFHAYDDPVTKVREYSLRMRDFVLRVLGWSFPPGHNDIYLFANPDQSANTKAGWYAAYGKDEKKKGSGSLRSALRASRAITRALPEERR
jgi:hypothetical protein